MLHFLCNFVHLSALPLRAVPVGVASRRGSGLGTILGRGTGRRIERIGSTPYAQGGTLQSSRIYVTVITDQVPHYTFRTVYLRLTLTIAYSSLTAEICFTDHALIASSIY